MARLLCRCTPPYFFTIIPTVLNKEYVYRIAVYQKISHEVGRIDNFRPLARKFSFLPTELDEFKHKFSSIWKWILRCCNDVMNHVDCVIKRDVYPQKMHVLKISMVYQLLLKKYSWYIKKYIHIMGDIAWIIAKLKDKYAFQDLQSFDPDR